MLFDFNVFGHFRSKNLVECILMSIYECMNIQICDEMCWLNLKCQTGKRKLYLCSPCKRCKKLFFLVKRIQVYLR